MLSDMARRGSAKVGGLKGKRDRHGMDFTKSQPISAPDATGDQADDLPARANPLSKSPHNPHNVYYVQFRRVSDPSPEATPLLGGAAFRGDLDGYTLIFVHRRCTFFHPLFQDGFGVFALRPAQRFRSAFDEFDDFVSSVDPQRFRCA